MKPLFVTLAVSVMSLASACATAHERNVTPGAETQSLLEQNRGVLLVNSGNGEYNCLWMYRLNKTDTDARGCAGPTGEPGSTVLFPVAFSGGKRIGKLVLVPGSSTQQIPDQWRIVTASSDGRGENMLAEWARQSPTESLYEKRMSISPDGRRIAIVKNADTFNVSGIHRGRFHQGSVQLLDLATKSWTPAAFEALDGEPVVWLDSDRVAYVKMIERKQLPALLKSVAASAVLDESERTSPLGGFGRSFSPLSHVPIVHIRSLSSGDERALYAGLNPVADEMRHELLLQDLALKLVSFNIETGNVNARKLPGIANRGVVGWISTNRVLYWAYATEGTTPETTKFNSPMVGPKNKLTLKVADLESQQFATIAAAIDPRRQASYSVD